jgi:hypothetical protein
MSESVSSITLPEVKVSKELNYSAALINRPKYRFQRILPQSGSQNSALSQGLEIIFELPPQTVYNLANTILSFTFTPLAGGANSTNWIFRDTIPFFDQIQL